MGGSNQATCPPASSSSKSRSKTPAKTAQNPIRFHEVTSRGECDFHDDRAGLKCAIDSATFFTAYNKWRPCMSDELTLVGNDGHGGHSSVTLLPYTDGAGELQVSMLVTKSKMGQSVLDLDKLATYS